MPATRVLRATAACALAALLGACGAAPSPVAAPRLAAPPAAKAIDATPREVAKLLDKDGDGLIVELEGWVRGHAEGEAFANYAFQGRPGKPVPTALVERALTTRGEVEIFGMAGGVGPDGRGTALTDAAVGRLAQGLGMVLANDPLTAAGQIPARVKERRKYGFRDDLDEVATFNAGALASAVRERLAKADEAHGVKLVSTERHLGRRYRVVLTSAAIL